MNFLPAVVLATLGVLLWYQPVQAMCAWFLWEHDHLFSKDFLVVATYPDFKGCDTRIETEVAKLQGGPRISRESGRVVIYALHNTRDFRCLPDTIDPRGPKGGGR